MDKEYYELNKINDDELEKIKKIYEKLSSRNVDKNNVNKYVNRKDRNGKNDLK